MLTCKPCAAQGERQGRILVFSPAFFHEMHRASARNRGIFNAEVVHGLQVRDVREGGVSQTGKPLKRAEIVHGLQVREGGVSQTGKPLKRAEVVHGLQVRDVREVGVSQTGKPLKRAEVVHGLQVRDVREVGVSQTGKPLKRAEVVHGLQVRYAREKESVSPPFSHSFHIFPLPAIN